MAKATVKCFGVLRLDSKIGKAEIEAEKIIDVFDKINELIETGMSISYDDALVYLNGERCKTKNKKLNDGDEVWLISPASGG